MHDLRLPLWGAVLLTIFFFCIGMWQIALFNIVLLVVQILGVVWFDLEPRLTVFLFVLILAIGSIIIGGM